MRNQRTVSAIVVSLLAGSVASAQPAFNFSAVSTLANGAVDGQNVSTPVPGFELLLMREGRIVYHGAFGNWQIGRVAAADSATKTLSGAVIMSLTDASVVPFSLASRISDFIPQFTGVKQGITVAQAFSHTSGLRNNNVAVSSQSMSLQQAALDIANDPIVALAGAEFSYGGTSMHAAGAAAEVAGGATWNTLFLQRIAIPLDMTQTRYVLSSPSNPRIAGGCESTAREFARFMEMLRRGGVHNGTRVLSTQAVQAMFTRQTPVGVPIANTPIDSPFTDGADYGVGVWLDDRGPAGELRGALAAGARGFSSWIDFDDSMVGVFATDLTISGNVQPLLYSIRDAAQLAVRAPIFCPADVDDGSGTGTRDRGVGIEDLLYYLGVFATGEVDADFDNGTNTGTPDGGVGIEDLLYYLERFEQGC